MAVLPMLAMALLGSADAFTTVVRRPPVLSGKSLAACRTAGPPRSSSRRPSLLVSIADRDSVWLPVDLRRGLKKVAKGRNAASLAALAAALASLMMGSPLLMCFKDAALAFLAWLLLAPSLLGMAKAAVYTLAASLFLCDSWRSATAYFSLVLPWWVYNKLSTALGAEDLRFLTHELYATSPEMRRLVEDHVSIRREWRRCPRATAKGLMQDLADYGGSLATQLAVFGPRHMDLYYDRHVRVAAVGHVLDDYVDQVEDGKKGQANYFNDFLPHRPEAKWGVEDWIQAAQQQRDFFEGIGDRAMVRFIDGSCGIPALFHKELRELFAKSRCPVLVN